MANNPLDPFVLVSAPDFPDPVQPEPSLDRETDADLAAVTGDVQQWLHRRIEAGAPQGYAFARLDDVPPALAAALVVFRRLLFRYGLPVLYGLPFTIDLSRVLFGQDVRLGAAGSELRGRRVLVIGERGSGKERVAEVVGSTLCALSGRPADLQRYNAAAFHEQTLMSTLFGHVKGAFTGATRDRPGVFERVDGGGAVFLDEVGDISAGLQVALLRVLESGEFHRLGAEERQPLTSEFHLIAATNRTPEELEGGRVIRADLVDRLAAQTVNVPTLREVLAGHADPQALFSHLLLFTHQELGLSWRVADSVVASADVARRVAAASRDYGWPGNLREAAASLRAAVWLGQPAIDALAKRARSDAGGESTELHWSRKGALDDALDRSTRRYYELSCRTAATINDVAEQLGVSRQRAARDLRRYGLRPLG